MASDWLVAVHPANQMPRLKIFVNYHGFLTWKFLSNPGHVISWSLYNSLEDQHPQIHSMGTWSSSEWLWFNLPVPNLHMNCCDFYPKIVHQDSSPSSGQKGAMPY